MEKYEAKDSEILESHLFRILQMTRALQKQLYIQIELDPEEVEFK